MRGRIGSVVLASILLAVGSPAAQPAVPSPAEPPAVQSPSAVSTQEPFDPVAATEAWLAKMPAEQRARSDAYFEGGYWLQLWDFLYGLGVAWLLLGTGLATRLRDWTERVTRFAFLRLLLFSAIYVVLTALLTFPLTVYEGFVREHQYGMATQAFGSWLRDQLVGLALGAVLGGLAITGIYGVLRRAPRTWWLWGTVVSMVFLVIAALIVPVFIKPLFNTYTELEDPALRAPILSLARANGIPVDHVYVVDASRQTNRISANVSGLLGTLRISLNDNLLKRTSPAAVQAVMGHEMGHYVLNHIYEMLIQAGVLLLAGFGFLRWSFDRVLRRWGAGWGVRGIGDIAGLPLLAAIFLVYGFVTTPLANTIIRTNEAEADLFGLNAARQPDGFAEASLLLGEYRKLAPGPIEEWLLFDHPSGRNRILMSMRWKAENLKEADSSPASRELSN